MVNSLRLNVRLSLAMVTEWCLGKHNFKKVPKIGLNWLRDVIKIYENVYFPYSSMLNYLHPWQLGKPNKIFKGIIQVSFQQHLD